MPWKNIKLNDGTQIPPIAWGSASAPKDDSSTAGQTEQAIEAGFEHIDTSDDYRNESGVGLGLKEAALPRKDLYLTTKFSAVDHKSPRELLGESLDKLGVEYVDLYLIHYPRAAGGDFEGTWTALEALKKDGLTKSIGVSNYTIDQLKTTLAVATTPPAVNQVPLHPYNYASQKPLLDFHAKHHIVTEAYSPLTPITKRPGGPLDKPLKELSKKYNAKEEQILLAWVRAKGAVIVTASSSKERLASYLAVGDLELSSKDVDVLDKAGAKGEFVSKIKGRVSSVPFLGVVAVALSLWALKAYIHHI